MGREKEAILEMLPYIRLGYISDSAEMNSVISSQGATCPVSKQKALCLLPANNDNLDTFFLVVYS